MIKTILSSVGLALAVLAPVAAAAEAAPALLMPTPAVAALLQQGGVRVWMDGNRDFYRENDRMRAFVRPDYDGYLAVFHIDTNGDLDVLYPRSYNDDGYVRGGRTVQVGSRGGWDHLRVRGGPGMGYVFAVTLDEPLELWRMRDLYAPRLARWDGSRSVWGDPFYAMDEVVRAIVPEGAQGYESVDYYTYHVGRRYSHPRYACYDGYGDWYGSRSSSYDSCGRVRSLLGYNQYYYDTRYWRGNRRVYYDRHYGGSRRVPRPMHGYKERTDSYAPPVRAGHQPRPRTSQPGGQASAPPASGRDSRPVATGGREVQRTDQGSPRRPEPRVAAPRRGDDDVPGGAAPAQQEPRQETPRQQGRPVAPQRDRPTFQRRPPSEEPRQAEPRREQPRREEPRRERTEPSRERAPERQAEPRREPPARVERSEPAERSRPEPRSGGSEGSSSRSSEGSPRVRPSEP